MTDEERAELLQLYPPRGPVVMPKQSHYDYTYNRPTVPEVTMESEAPADDSPLEEKAAAACVAESSIHSCTYVGTGAWAGFDFGHGGSSDAKHANPAAFVEPPAPPNDYEIPDTSEDTDQDAVHALALCSAALEWAEQGSWVDASGGSGGGVSGGESDGDDELYASAGRAGGVSPPLEETLLHSMVDGVLMDTSPHTPHSVTQLGDVKHAAPLSVPSLIHALEFPPESVTKVKVCPAVCTAV